MIFVVSCYVLKDCHCGSLFLYLYIYQSFNNWQVGIVILSFKLFGCLYIYNYLCYIKQQIIIYKTVGSHLKRIKNMTTQNTNNQLFTSISELENLLKQMKENKLKNQDMSDYITIDLDSDRHLEKFRTSISGIQHSHSGNNEEVIFL